MVRLRSIQFFKYVNPSIKNGGLYGDSKMKIYQLLPQTYYPKTILIEKSKSHDFQWHIEKNQFSFPLIVKPDKGCRGFGVKKVYSLTELHAYDQSVTYNYLIQELIHFPNEIGLFYCRMPDEKQGKITGITLKKFLVIEGNGKDSLETLLYQNPRYNIQVSKLRKDIDVNVVLKAGEKLCLVPFGNHSRGTEFLDGKHCITPELSLQFDKLLASIPGFYFGRLDIRFNSFEDLEHGKNFSIIELNGVKSEPTHIYDPKHSFWFGQKEIMKHQKILVSIARSNMKQPVIALV